MFKLYVLKIDRNLEKEYFYKLINYISEENRTRISKYYRFEDAQRSLLGDILARYSICKWLGINNKELIIQRNKYGKPILFEPKMQSVHFNISHSENWVLCVIDDKPIGIDIETIRPINLDISRNSFSLTEQKLLAKQPDEKKLEYFYKLWTLKECYIKAKGKGLYIPLTSFTINIRKCEPDGKDCSTVDDHFYQNFLDSTTIYAICSSTLCTFFEQVFFYTDSFLQKISTSSYFQKYDLY